MARKLTISQVMPSAAGTPGMFITGSVADEAAGNWTPVFKGQFYRDAAGNVAPFYTNGSTPTPPAGYQLVVATSFSVIDNPSYNGRYTVYTKVSSTDPHEPSSFSTGQTTIRVQEQVGAPQSGAHLTIGFITNISTYYIVYPTGGAATSALVVPPGVAIDADFPVELVGRNFSGWGEVLQTGLVRVSTNFAGPVAPIEPAAGVTWFNTTTNTMQVWNGSTWALLNSNTFAPIDSVRVPFTAVANTPVAITHNLGVPSSPFICHHSFFIDAGSAVYKPILPADVTYVNANRFDVTFSTNYTGIALIRR